ncbi:hypothetical protein ILUMI_01869 [Ignelater luminosus]|uniref:CCAAT/enhancer-binding protein zeta n=1 Tax=Ignelater luminosus TaxID=2038154 RepID=A0A8K0GLB8_IGNLU|nr:hypothetical protein ILUMI_01869 [Ignelater luminosus]
MHDRKRVERFPLKSNVDIQYLCNINFKKMTKAPDYNKPNMWYDQEITQKNTSVAIEEDILITLKDEAKKCLNSDVANYNSRNSKTNSNFQWMKTIMAKGVTSDKIAAFIVAIQDDPIHNLDTLSNLVGMVKVGKKKECIIVVENLVELFLTNLLPSTRKLIPFRQRPLNSLNDLCSGNAVTRRKYLSVWYFEDQLKETYATFVRALNSVAHDAVDHNKEKALIAMYKLLAGNPEQEKNLLTNIINKLGDPSRKVASKSIYCLTQLLHEHSNMQGVVLGEIEKLLFRPNIQPRAQYYCLCFLSQFYLHHEASEIAKRLIDVYFSFFKACVKKGEVNSRMMSALLMGVNRAYPYAKMESDKISDHINTMYRVVHVANFNVSLHALTLLFQVSGDAEVSDRFYSALYKKLLDPQISSTTHQAMLISLVYKALNRDTKIDRIKVFIKRLLQNAIFMQSSMASGILYIISQLLSRKPDLSALILKASNFSILDEENDEEEKYVDIKDEEDEKKLNVTNEKHEEADVEVIEDKVTPSWVHGVNINGKAKVSKTRNAYDGFGRNPLYAGGEFCAYTELNMLKNHFHPTVSLFARNLLNGETIRYSGDPLKDFSLIKFLDRFVFKNPKQLEEVKGYHPTFGKRKNYAPNGIRNLSVNSRLYLNEKQKNIPIEELYLYTFLQKKYRERKNRGDDNEEESDLESVASDEFEEMLDKMTGSGKDVDEDLDYMDAVGENLKSSKNKKEKDADNDGDENESDDEDELEDEEDDFDMDGEGELEMNEEDKELTQISDDEEGSDIVFDSEDDDEKETPKKKRKKNDDVASLFASAEEFASLLEDEGSSNRAPGSSNAWANKDNANMKQISWEENRNRWVKGYDKQMKKHGKKFNNKKGSKSFNNKGGFQNKNKKKFK